MLASKSWSDLWGQLVFNSEQERKHALHSDQKVLLPGRNTRALSSPARSAASGSEDPGARGVFALVSGSDAPISSRGFRTSAFTETRAPLPKIKVCCAIFDESEKNQVVEKSLHSPRHRPLWTEWGFPRRRAAALREASAVTGATLTRGFNRGVVGLWVCVSGGWT